jgi:iron-sulfur cluster repair di-iron protein
MNQIPNRMQIHTIEDFIHQPVSELVVAKPWAKQILNRYDLDFCCGGNLTLSEACLAKGLDASDVLNEIDHAQTTPENLPLRVQDWSTPFLIDFIEQNYHRYVRDAIPVLLELLDKVCLVHGVEHPELLQVKNEFGELAEELLSHMKKEEMILFPALRELDQNERANPIVMMIDRPIAAMEEEHQMAGDILKFLRVQTNRYTPPPEACPTFIFTYQKLAEFDQELVNHIHLENNVLFKRVL